MISLPSEVPIAITTSVERSSSSSSIRVLPSSTLAEGWYRLSVEKPGTLSWPDYPDFQVDGSEGSSTFRVGSQPMVRAIELCLSDAPAKQKVRVEVSEPVVFAESSGAEIGDSRAGATVSCSRIAESSEDGSGAPRAATVVAYACTGIGEMATITVALDKAFSAVGQPDVPATQSSVSFTFSLSELQPSASACLRYTPDVSLFLGRDELAGP